MRTLIVDDEPLGRERIRTLLASEPDVEIAGECADGESAVAAIRTLAPDLVFLDIQMPGMNGFAVLEALDHAALPVIVFVTAFDQYAIRAFEVRALDYLLKPFDRDRFQETLVRARLELARRGDGKWAERLLSILDDLPARKQYVERLAVRSGGRVVFLRVDELDWAEAAGNYVKLHAGREVYLHRETMGDLETMLDPARFARIHRSTIVNLDRVQELHPLFRGEYTVVLRGGKQLTLSRTYRDRLKL